MRTATSIRKQPMDINEFNATAFFDVVKTPAAYMNDFGVWIPTPDKVALMTTEGKYISTVGKNYSIVDNKNYFDGVISALTDGGIEYTPKQAYVDQSLKRTTMIVELPQFKLFKGTSEEQAAELRIRNSFDTTIAADAILGWLRLVCTNGMTAFEQDFKSRIVHKGNILEKTAKDIELYKSFDTTWQRNNQIIEYMGNTNGSKKAVSEYIGDGEFTRNTIFTGNRWARRLQQKWQEDGEPINLWQIYNIFTNIISHSYGNEYTSKSNKMDALNKEVRTWHKQLGVVARPNTFN